jgi:hypothetical protein
MPENGEINKEFGVYRSLCCGAEIVIPAGTRFPDCPKHPRLTTVWKPVNDREFSEILPQPKKGEPAA